MNCNSVHICPVIACAALHVIVIFVFNSWSSSSARDLLSGFNRRNGIKYTFFNGRYWTLSLADGVVVGSFRSFAFQPCLDFFLLVQAAGEGMVPQGNAKLELNNGKEDRGSALRTAEMASTRLEEMSSNGCCLKDEKNEIERKASDFLDLQYQRGFGNHFTSEALNGALPQGQNSPLKCPYGLYAEQLSGTAFTVPRRMNQHSWLYRIKPSVTHEPFVPRKSQHQFLACDFTDSSTTAITPTQLRWKPEDLPNVKTDFLDGLYTICGAGSPFLRHGYAIHIYGANSSMDNCAFANADGDFLIVPQQGRLWITTECGRLEVSPGEVVVLPHGFRFSIALPDGPSRGYIVEVYSGHFQLPDLGPIGANGLADPRDFLTPVAWYEEKTIPDYTIIHKFGGQLFESKQDFSPFNVVAWQGNYVPYKYDLRKFCPYNTVLFDHADPSINTVLTVPSERPGVAVVDLVVFPPRWLVAEHTFRPPYFHRNCMSEFMGLICGSYEGKADGFLPGGASLHNCMSPHGVDTPTYERAISGDDSKPAKIDGDTLAFMFESCLIPRVTAWAFDSPKLDKDYYKGWIGLRSHFDSKDVPK